MIAFPPALRRSGFVAPRAVNPFALAILEARQAALEPAPAPRELVRSAEPPAPPPRTIVRLWLPLTPLFLVLAPFAVLLAPLGYFAPARYRVRPFAAVFGLGRLLMSLSGTLIHVDTPEALVTIRLF